MVSRTRVVGNHSRASYASTTFEPAPAMMMEKIAVRKEEIYDGKDSELIDIDLDMFERGGNGGKGGKKEHRELVNK